MKTPTSPRLVSKLLLLLPLLFLGNSASAVTYEFSAALAAEASVASPGIGQTTVIYDDTAQTMRVIASFSGLTAGVTASHIHAATAIANTGNAGVATQTPTFFGFPAGVTFGSYDNTFDMTLNSSYNNAYRIANGGLASTASAALLAAILAEKTYLNIHTTTNPGGEIRGYLHLVSVPEDGVTLLFLSATVLSLAAIGRRRKLAA